MSKVTIEELQTKLEHANKTIEEQQKQISELEHKCNTLQALYEKMQSKKHNERGAGRKPIADDLKEQVKVLRKEGNSIKKISQEIGLSVGAVHKIISDKE